jgi:hypothetical protein
MLPGDDVLNVERQEVGVVLVKFEIWSLGIGARGSVFDT